MSKYIIELFDGVQVLTGVGASPSGTVWSKSYDVDELEELNSDYINEHYGKLQDEAYRKGYADGREVGIKDGMCEAWEAAKKIALMDTETSEKVTGYFGLFRIMENLTAMQAIEKLKAYENKRKDRIEVGDEVKAEDGRVFVVTEITNKGSIYGFDKDGMWLIRVKDRLRKTGKHYDIQSILEAMRE